MFASRLLIKQQVSRRLIPSSTLSKLTTTQSPGFVSPLQIFSRNYAIVHKDLTKKKSPRLRYMFLMVAISFSAMYFVSHSVDKRVVKKSFSEGEFKDYEQQTGLKRRHKLLGHDMNQKYKFYVVPYVHDQTTLDKIVTRLLEVDDSKKVKVIDPQELIVQEKQDERNKYCYLLEDLEDARKPFPPGLITALIKQYISFFMNTRDGTFDTTFVIKNYPQHTAEAIKFENDVSDIHGCILLQDDIVNQLPNVKDDDGVRAISNVDGYFGSVGKSYKLTNSGNQLDGELKKVITEDF